MAASFAITTAGLIDQSVSKYSCGCTASTPRGRNTDGGKCLRLKVTITEERALTAAAKTCRSFSSFVIAGSSTSQPVIQDSGNARVTSWRQYSASSFGYGLLSFVVCVR